METDYEEVEEIDLVTRLECNQNDVQELKYQLNSYTCEPCTYRLFERIDVLRRGLEALSATNREIITSLRGGRRSIENYMDRAKTQLQEFNRLKQGVEQYVSDAHSY